MTATVPQTGLTRDVPLRAASSYDERPPAPFMRSAFASVRTARLLAFLVDICIVFGIQVVGFVLILLLALPTLGASTLALGPLFITPLVAILYNGFTIGGSRQATIGQRLNGVVMARQDGRPVDFLLGATHALFFYVSNVFLTPAVLAVSLFDREKRLLHDLALGLVVVRRR